MVLLNEAVRSAWNWNESDHIGVPEFSVIICEQPHVGSTELRRFVLGNRCQLPSLLGVRQGTINDFVWLFSVSRPIGWQQETGYDAKNDVSECYLTICDYSLSNHGSPVFPIIGNQIFLRKFTRILVANPDRACYNMTRGTICALTMVRRRLEGSGVGA